MGNNKIQNLLEKPQVALLSKMANSLGSWKYSDFELGHKKKEFLTQRPENMQNLWIRKFELGTSTLMLNGATRERGTSTNQDLGLFS